MSEADEWLDELVTSWVEVHKKSATTLLLLRIVAVIGPAPATEIGGELNRRTGWAVTERGLYRTLKRMASNDLLDSQDVAVPRTGVARKDFTITAFGRRYLERIQAEAAVTTRSEPSEPS